MRTASDGDMPCCWRKIDDARSRRVASARRHTIRRPAGAEAGDLGEALGGSVEHGQRSPRPKISTMRLAYTAGPMPCTMPEPRYRLRPSRVEGATVMRVSTLSCSPCFLSFS